MEAFDNVDEAFGSWESVFSTDDHSSPLPQLATRANKLTIYFVSVATCIIFFIIALVLLLSFFDDMELPHEVGVSNYFVWNMLTFVTNTPGNLFLVLLPALYFALMNNEDLTVRGSVMLSISSCVFGYFFSVIFAFPSWVVNTVVSYYVLDKGLGLSTSSFANGTITAIIIALIFFRVIGCFRQKKNMVKVLPDEIPIVELPVLRGCGTIFASNDKGEAILDDDRGPRTADQTMVYNVMVRSSSQYV